MQRRWLALDADVVSATEMTCWVGRACTPSDLQEFYSHSRALRINSTSPYIHSTFYGTRNALADILGRILQFYPNGTGTFNDQKAATELQAGKIASPWRLGIDDQQSIVGSCVYSQHELESCYNATEPWLTCWDARKASHMHNCCGDNVPMQDNENMFGILAEKGDCDIYRKPSNATQYWHVAFAGLESHPLLWHGNGPGRPACFRAFVESEACRQQKQNNR